MIQTIICFILGSLFTGYCAPQTFGAGVTISSVATSTFPSVIIVQNANSTSTFSGGITATYLNLTGVSATSTSARGINLSGGCFAVNGSCVTSSGGTVTSVGLSDSNSTLTIGGTPITTSGTLTATLNLGSANTWTALQRFDQASSTRLSIFDLLYIGGSATSTIQGAATGTSTIQGFLNVSGTNSTSTISGNLTVSATTSLTGCIGCLSGYEKVTNAVSLETTDTGQTTATAACTTGKKVIGGGLTSTVRIGWAGVGPYSLLQNYPATVSSWVVKVQCDTGGSCTAGTLTAYAICAYP